MLGSLLAAEHEAVYAYGVLGARLDAAQRELALVAFDAHRFSREGLVVRLRAAGVVAASPPPGYAVSVANQLEALRLAIHVETDLGARWRDLAGETTDPDLRKLAVQGLSGCAVRATRWRIVAGVVPLTDPFPGQT